MPFLKIQTNANLNGEQQKATIAAASESVASMLNKPEQYVLISLEQNPNMMFAGTNKALAYLELKSIDLPEDKTAEFAAKLCALVSHYLEVDPDRVYIEFASAQRHLWGWNNATF